MHYSGGVAIAFLFWHTLDCFAPWFGRLTSFARYLFTFALACTMGLFWEFAEFYSDVVYGTHIQQTIRETLRDLIADATGALTTLLLILLVSCFTRRKASSLFTGIAACVFLGRRGRRADRTRNRARRGGPATSKKRPAPGEARAEAGAAEWRLERVRTRRESGLD
jgi:hypothetical protein